MLKSLFTLITLMFIAFGIRAQNQKRSLYPKAESAMIGTLQKIPEPGKTAAFVHQYLFRFEEGQWSGAVYSYVGERRDHNATALFPTDQQRNLFFDGRNLQSVSLPKEECLVPPSSLTKDTLKILTKFPEIVSTSSVSQDPDSWKTIPLIKAPFKETEYLSAWNDFADCPKDKQTGQKPLLKLEKIYSSKDQRRFLVIAKKSRPCVSTGDDFADKALMFRNAKGEWIIAEGQALIDIGDFNADGKVEGLFKGTPIPPEESYLLKDMSTFKTLSEVRSQVGGGGGKCYDRMGE